MKVIPAGNLKASQATVDVESLETEAKATALKHVMNMLQRPDQLEKVDQYMQKVSRKKAAVEAMLKTVMQSQLDGVCSGLNQLKVILNDLKMIKENMQEIEETLNTIPKMSEDLRDIKDEHLKHSQFAAAMENLKHIFTVPECVANTQTWINDGKLLQAHHSLHDLENSRDDLLYELFKLPNKNSSDQTMLLQYFADVEKLIGMLSKQLWLIMKRALNTVRKEPTVIVTVLRIIEREEKADQFAILRQRQTGFIPPGRPKRFREKVFQVLEEAVQERIEGNQFEERKDNKMWLVRHLEVTRLLILEDLRVVKTLCVPCFPPEYDILNKYVKMHHDCLSRHFEDIIATGLEGNEFITLLTWLNTYQGKELLRHPDLNIDPSQIELVLDKTTVDDLVCQYLKMMESNFEEWMKKILDKEIQDWQREMQPESDGEGYYHTMVPVMVFEMIDQNLEVAKTTGEDIVNRVMLLFMQQVTKFGKCYKDAILDFKNKYYEDRGQVKFFTQYMIAIGNNCLQFIELSYQLKNKYWKPGVMENNMATELEKMINTYQNLRDEALKYLLEEIFLDLEPHLQDLLTKKWLESSVTADTICVTFEDYYNDYLHLRPKNFEALMTDAQKHVCKGYLKAIFQRKPSYRNDERVDSAEKLIKEAQLIKKMFVKLAPTVGKDDSPFEIIVSLAEVLKIKDPEMVSLEVTGMVRKYPDITPEHLAALLNHRSDIGRSDIKHLISMIFPEGKQVNRGLIPKSLLSEIYIPKSILDIQVSMPTK